MTNINNIIKNISKKDNIILNNINRTMEKNKKIVYNLNDDVYLVQNQVRISNNELYKKENTLFILRVITTIILMLIILKLLVKLSFISIQNEIIYISLILLIGFMLIGRVLYSFYSRRKYDLSEKKQQLD